MAVCRWLYSYYYTNYPCCVEYIAPYKKEHLHCCADALYDGLIGQVTFIICSII